MWVAACALEKFWGSFSFLQYLDIYVFNCMWPTDSDLFLNACATLFSRLVYRTMSYNPCDLIVWRIIILINEPNAVSKFGWKMRLKNRLSRQAPTGDVVTLWPKRLHQINNDIKRQRIIIYWELWTVLCGHSNGIHFSSVQSDLIIFFHDKTSSSHDIVYPVISLICSQYNFSHLCKQHGKRDTSWVEPSSMMFF